MKFRKLRMLYLLILCMFLGSSAITSIKLSSGSFVHAKMRSPNQVRCEDDVRLNNELGIFMVLDGHNGTKGRKSAVIIAQENLEKNIRAAWSDVGSATEKIKNAFATTSSEIDASTQTTGCAAVVAFFPKDEREDNLHIANLGDTRAILAYEDSGSVTARFVSEEHRLSNPNEKERIRLLLAMQKESKEPKSRHSFERSEESPKKKQKHLHNDAYEEQTPSPVKPESTELPAPFFSPTEASMIQTRPDPNAITRRFGLKKKRKKGISDDPDITSIALSKKDRFVILMSDGVSEHIAPDEAVKIVAQNIERDLSLDRVAEELAKSAAFNDRRNCFVTKDCPFEENNDWKKGIRDDMSVVIIKIEHTS